MQKIVSTYREISNVSKIEYISLEVKKEKFNLNKIILNTNAVCRNQIVRDNKDK
jgi:hypothetical protein